MVRWGWLVLGAAVAVVIAATGSADAQEGCGVPAASSWTATEAAVWQQLCAGQPADLNREAENLDPHQPDGWDESRVLSSAFVEQLLEEPYAPVIDRHGIRLGGAWFPDGLDIHEAAFGFPLRCQFCRIAGLRAENAVIDGDLDLRASAIEGDLSLLGANIRAALLISDGSVVSGVLTADDLTVAGAMFLDDESQFRDIGLRNADVGSNLEVGGGSVVSGVLNADRLTVVGAVFLDDGSEFRDIDLLGADIGGDLYVDEGSVVSGTLNADGLTVAGHVFLNSGSRFADIRLIGASIGGQLAAVNGSVVSGTLDASRATVAGDVFLNGRSQFNIIRLVGAEVRGLIYLYGARWEPGGSLELRQAHAGGVWTDERAESLPATLDLDGFTFEQWVQPDPRELGIGWFIDYWLGRLGQFSPGPYDQLAAVMDAGGHSTIAADVRYERSDQERLAVPWTRPDRWGRLLHELVLGYGYKPWRALLWFLAAWFLGFLLLWLRLAGLRVARSEWSAGQAALFSLDRLVPAISLADPDGFPPRTKAQQVWSTGQMLMGWLLTLFIVGWLGGLLVQG